MSCTPPLSCSMLCVIYLSTWSPVAVAVPIPRLTRVGKYLQQYHPTMECMYVLPTSYLTKLPSVGESAFAHPIQSHPILQPVAFATYPPKSPVSTSSEHMMSCPRPQPVRPLLAFQAYHILSYPLFNASSKFHQHHLPPIFCTRLLGRGRRTPESG
jgi:hypothetical protein